MSGMTDRLRSDYYESSEGGVDYRRLYGDVSDKLYSVTRLADTLYELSGSKQDPDMRVVLSMYAQLCILALNFIDKEFDLCKLTSLREKLLRDYPVGALNYYEEIFGGCDE